MHLRDFMRDAGLDQAAIATKLNLTQGSVSRILRRGTASVGVALRIEKLTGGKVSAEQLNDEVAVVRKGARAA